MIRRVTSSELPEQLKNELQLKTILGDRVVEVSRHDIIIVGAGAAGIRAAIAAAEIDPSASIAMVSKVYPMRSHTVSAEGGAAAVAREDDNFELHGFDTVKGSDFLGD